MPPRLPLPNSVASSGSSIPHSTSALELAIRTCQASPSRSFSTTSHRDSTIPRARYQFYQWLKKQGAELKEHSGTQFNYLRETTPFPSNPTFHSQSVLSEQMRNLIHQRVSLQDEPIMVVSADLGVDHRRVAAVVRMKEIEADWKRMGKKLATPYRRAVMNMLPVHQLQSRDTDGLFDDEEDKQGEGEEEDGPATATPFEPINEIHVHGHTMQQLFVPTSESRHFTREDAAKAFNERMLSADDRVPHKELVKHHRRVKDGMGDEASWKRFVAGARAAEKADVMRDAELKEREKRITLAVPTERAEFRFQKMMVDDGGPAGRSRRGVGWRYGAPSEDRKKDQVKHPVKYE